MSEASPIRLTIGTPEFPVRFHFSRFFKPKQRTNKQGALVGDPKYGTMVIVPKNAPYIKDILAAMAAAGKEKFPDKKFEALDTVWRDGDSPKEEEKGDAVKGCYFFNCTSTKKPSVVGTDRNPLDNKLEPLGEDDIKWGDYGRVSINFYGFEEEGNKGVAAGLNNVQKLKDGDPLGNQRSADDDFGDVL